MSQGFSKFYQVSINENQSEYNGQSESWIVSQWANDREDNTCWLTQVR